MCAKAGRGRPASAPLVRRVISLIGGLEKKGDTISVEGICSRFSVDEDEALRTIQLIIGAAMSGDLCLPIDISADEREIRLSFDSDVRGRAVRLTCAETAAIRFAMDSMGLEPTDEIRLAVERAFSSDELDRGAATAQPAGQSSDADTLQTIAESLVEGTTLAFAYHGGGQSAPAERRVVPIDLHRDGGAWYLDAHDLDRDALRTFRVDRMEDIRKTLEAEPASSGQDGDVSEARQVELVFTDPAYFHLFDWPDIVGAYTDEGFHGFIPYYGGDWLIRHIAACRGTVLVKDEEIAARVRDWVQEQLKA